MPPHRSEVPRHCLTSSTVRLWWVTQGTYVFVVWSPVSQLLTHGCLTWDLWLRPVARSRHRLMSRIAVGLNPESNPGLLDRRRHLTISESDLFEPGLNPGHSNRRYRNYRKWGPGSLRVAERCTVATGKSLKPLPPQRVCCNNLSQIAPKTSEQTDGFLLRSCHTPEFRAGCQHWTESCIWQQASRCLIRPHVPMTP